MALKVFSTDLDNSSTSLRSANSSGFTIVELLIVVVVIAILAAIAIVSYTGITQRAQNVETIANVRQVWNAVKMHVQVENRPPLAGVLVNMYEDDDFYYPGAAVCIGEGYQGGRCGSLTGGETNEEWDEEILEDSRFCEEISSYVRCPLPPMTDSGRSVANDWFGEGVSIEFQNAVYTYQINPESPNDYTYGVSYMLMGDVDCGISSEGDIVEDYQQSDNTTYCLLREYGGSAKETWIFDSD